MKALVKRIITFPGYFRNTTSYLFLFEELDSLKIYTWSTSSYADYWDENDKFLDTVREGDIVEFDCRITNTVKEYKGIEQTKIMRCRNFKKISHEKTFDERKAEEEAKKELERENRKKTQLDSISENDIVWTMAYSRYKKFYGDCETLIDSYREGDNCKPSTITVIIRNGRLKNSGVRGQQYSYFIFCNEEGKTMHIKAISEDSAKRQVAKKFKGEKWFFEKEIEPWSLRY